MSRAFEGIRIVDFTQVLAGPFATYQLGLLGADIIKIESPDGDLARPMFDNTSFGHGVMSPLFIGVNHNKRSLAVDLKRPEGRAAVERIVRRADVLVENFKPGVIGRLGFDHETVRAWCPSIIYCSISGYGQQGPRSALNAFDGAIQAASGMMMANGHEETGPTRTSSPIVDVTTGLNAAFAIAAALHRRAVTGRGQHLDVAMLDSAVCLINPLFNNYLATGEEPELLGNQSITKLPTANVFATADGHLQIIAITEPQIERLLEVLDCPELQDDPRCASMATMVEHRDAIREALVARMREETNAFWLERFDAARVPASSVVGLPEVMADPQLDTRQLTATLPAPDGLGVETMTSVTSSFVADEDGTAVHTFAPWPGEHSREVLAEHDFAPEEIEALHADGVVVSPERAKTSPDAVAAGDD